MKKVFSFLLAVTIMITTIICASVSVYAADVSESSISKICKLREETAADIKITDVRNNLSSIAAEFNHEELEEILEMVNDYYNDTFAEETHYENIMSALSNEDVKLVYETIMNPSASLDLPMGLIVIVIVGVIVLVAIVFIIITLVKKQGLQQQNTIDRRNRANNDETYNESQSNNSNQNEPVESKAGSRASNGNKTVVIQDED